MDNENQSKLLKALLALDQGDFTIALDENDENLDCEIAATVNRIAHRMDALSLEIRRVSREIGTYGMFGGQAEVYGLEGGWQQLAGEFNSMAEVLTIQMRQLSNATHDLAEGKPMRPITIEARGETLGLVKNVQALEAGIPA